MPVSRMGAHHGGQGPTGAGLNCLAGVVHAQRHAAARFGNPVGSISQRQIKRPEVEAARRRVINVNKLERKAAAVRPRHGAEVGIAHFALLGKAVGEGAITGPRSEPVQGGKSGSGRQRCGGGVGDGERESGFHRWPTLEARAPPSAPGRRSANRERWTKEASGCSSGGWSGR